jgi:hypothetical protein
MTMYSGSRFRCLSDSRSGVRTSGTASGMIGGERVLTTAAWEVMRIPVVRIFWAEEALTKPRNANASVSRSRRHGDLPLDDILRMQPPASNWSASLPQCGQFIAVSQRIAFVPRTSRYLKLLVPHRYVSKGSQSSIP